MPIDDTCTFRYISSNLLAGDLPSVTYSTQDSDFPFTNALNTERDEFWKPTSYFVIDSDNNKVYINDGSDKTITLDNDSYTGDTLATEIQTKLNASSSDWTVTYESDYAFNISNTSSVTLQLSNDTDAVWETIGFISGTDTTGTSFDADEQRNHWPYQWFKCDFGYQANIGFLGMITSLGDEFPISSLGSVTIEANNIDDFSSPPLSVEAEVTANGVFKFLDTLDSAYRYWRVKITDPYYSEGPQISIGNITLSEYQSFTARNISNGFSYQYEDRSQRQEAESGKYYFDVKDKRKIYGGMEAALLDKTNRAKVDDLFKEVGLTVPFYISIDPQGEISSDLDEFTNYVFFDSPPSMTHVFHEYFNANFALREAF